MDFDLSDEQYMLQDEVRKFFLERAPNTYLNKLYTDNADLDRGLWKEASELGITAIGIPEEFGGAGLSMIDEAVVAEMQGYCAAPGPFSVHALASFALVNAGTDAQKSRWLPTLASGKAVGTIALSETGSRWQPDEWRLSGERGRLSGQKRSVVFAKDADLFIVGLAGGALGLVENGAPGLTIDEIDSVDRTRKLATLTFDNTPFDALPDGKSTAERLRDAGLVLLAADSFGGAMRSIELIAEYSKTREQFGKTIAHFQGVKHQISDVVIEVEPARGLYWYAAYAFEHAPKDSPRMAALAKAHLADRYTYASRKMLELHGGIGFTWEFYAHFWLKRAIFNRQYLGAPSVHRERAAQLAGW